jgi:hypothetical protein
LASLFQLSLIFASKVGAYHYKGLRVSELVSWLARKKHSNLLVGDKGKKSFKGVTPVADVIRLFMTVSYEFS